MAIRILNSENITGDITVSGTAVIGNTLYLAEYIQHTGNTSNNIRFTTDAIAISATANFGNDVTIGGTTGATGNALSVNRGSDGAQAMRIQNSGEVVIPSNYLYCNARWCK